jgi:hypothetical protein
MLRLTVRNELAPQNIRRYRRGVALSDVAITGLDCIFYQENQHNHEWHQHLLTKIKQVRKCVRFPVFQLYH